MSGRPAHRNGAARDDHRRRIRRGGRTLTETLWVHASQPSNAEALAELFSILQQNRPSLKIVATGGAVPETWRASPGPGGHRLAHKAFLEHHKPEAVLFCGRLDPALVAVADRQELTAIWADAILPDRRRWSLFVRTQPETLPRTVRVIVTGPGREQDALLRNPAISDRVETPGFLQPVPHPLPCDTGERDRMAEVLAARPVWLAAAPPADEYDAILAAHRMATRRSHRLLLIVACAEGAGPALVEQAQASGWTVASHAAGELPDGDIQILVVDGLGKLGLWYRLAPITFLGGSLSDRALRSPYEPATLGSAVLHGPKTRAYSSAFQALARAGGARRVDGGATLGRAVSDLLAPEAAARMATAAWDVATAGAPALNRVAELVEDALDGVLAP